MKCPKCKTDNEPERNYCSNCSNFLYRPILKELLFIIKRYNSRNDFQSILELLYKAKKLFTQIEILKNNAVTAFNERNYKKSLENYRKILDFPLKTKERKKFENALIQVKAIIYSMEMKDLTYSHNQLFADHIYFQPLQSDKSDASLNEQS